MFKPLILIAGILALLSFTDDKLRQVSGKIFQTASYCGDGTPSAETLKQLQTPKPLAGKKCFVRKGKTNNAKEPVLASFISDSLGNFMIHLAPGEYCIVDARKYDKNFVADIAKDNKKSADLDCLKTWLNTPDAVFTVGADGENRIEVTYNIPCGTDASPCVKSVGN